jgi:hypothetical protein
MRHDLLLELARQVHIASLESFEKPPVMRTAQGKKI